jgi:transposase
MAVVMIGVDPHKASHTAVAVAAEGEPLGQLQARASAVRARRLLEWAAVAGAVLGGGRRQGPGPPAGPAGGGGRGTGAGRAAKLASRVRLLAHEAVNKNDPNDARSIAVTALRSRTVRVVTTDDHCVVGKMWSRRHHDLGWNRTRIACRLHAALCELVPGGIGKEITTAHAAGILARAIPSGAVRRARAPTRSSAVRTGTSWPSRRPGPAPG